MNVREEVLLAVVEGRLGASDGAKTLGVTEAEFLPQVDVVRALAAHHRARRRRSMWGFGVLGALAVSLGFAGSAFAAAGCAQTLPAPLITFCSDTPANADEVNGNFLAVINMLVAKVGPLNTPTAITTAGLTTTGVLSTSGGLTISSGGATVTGITTLNGPTTLNGAVNVTGYVTQGCPTTFPLLGGAVDMVDMGAYCIQRVFDGNNGKGAKSWFSTNEYCINRGLRMCSFPEVSAAARLGRITTYDFATTNNDVWVWVDQTSTDNNNVGFGGCHVNLNSNKGLYLLGETNCSIDGNVVNAFVGGLCCL